MRPIIGMRPDHEHPIERLRAVRVPIGMRPFLLLATLLAGYGASAQCCCAHQVVEIHTADPVRTNGASNYTATLTEGPDLHRMVYIDPGDPRTLQMRIPTLCGIGPITWTVREEHTGQVMRIRLYHLPGDLHLPTIRMPFTGGGSFHFDMNDILLCLPRTGAGGAAWSHEFICRTGRMHYSATDGGYPRIEPLDLEPWTREPRPITRDTGPQEARYLDGEDGLQAYLADQVAQPLIEPLPGPVIFTGHAVVEPNGTVIEVLFDAPAHQPIEEAIRTALQRSARWQPAVVERPSFPEGPKNYLAIRHPVPFRFVADPRAMRIR